MHNLANNCKWVRLAGAVSAGTDGSRTALTEIDTQGYDGVALVVQLGTVTSNGVTTVKAKTSDTSASYGAGTIGDIGPGVSGTNGSNKSVWYDVSKLTQRYLRFDYQRTVANVAVESIHAVLYNPTTGPVTDSNKLASAVVSGAAPSAT